MEHKQEFLIVGKTDLEKSGRLEKTGAMRAGGYGKPNHVWKVKTVA